MAINSWVLFKLLRYTASNVKLAGKYDLGEDIEGADVSYLKVLSHFPGGLEGLKKTTKNPVRIAGLRTEIGAVELQGMLTVPASVRGLNGFVLRLRSSNILP
jgi:hypothetical protein